MTDLCEIVEAFGEATSSTPAVEVVLITIAAGNGASGVVTGVTPVVITDSASATSTAYDSQYAVLLSTAAATGTEFPTFVISASALSDAEGRSALFVSTSESVSSSGASQSTAYPDIVTPLLVSAATATSTVTTFSSASMLLLSAGAGTSDLQIGWLESVSSSAATASSVTPQRVLSTLLVNTGSGTSEVVPFTRIADMVLESTAGAASLVELQIDMAAFLNSTAASSSDVWYKDPGRVAYVLNTETAAGSWYDNFDFESIAQPPGYVLAVGPDGLYALSGATDSGEQIDAYVKPGFVDFGTANTKRVDQIYFGYTSTGQIATTVEVYESGHSPQTYYLEQRDAEAPRNSRITPGKALNGRYWRITVRNVAGADFEIHDASVDIAVSPRRV